VRAYAVGEVTNGRHHVDAVGIDEANGAELCSLLQAVRSRVSAQAALVFDGDRAAAWCEYGTPEELPNVQHNKQYLAELDILPDYRLTASSWTATTAARVWPASRSTEPCAQAGGGVVEWYP
jgi:hypothetical protein